MKRVVIFGNSGSGKSTLAGQLSESEHLAHFDLDTVAWQSTTSPERRPINESMKDIHGFIDANESWVIEGCYSDLLEIAIPKASEIIFLNLPIELCIANARKRPWEPHKYPSKAAQDANLDMLIEWIAQYPERTDLFSKASHEDLFDRYKGKKSLYTSNQKQA